MATATAALPARHEPTTPATALRALHAWHLLSLDAPTVAFSAMLLFAHAAHLPHAWPAALALACAVWVVYAGDRLMDSAASRGGCGAVPPLEAMYASNAKGFLLACCAVTLLTVVAMAALPLRLRLGWMALSLPLLVYAVAVHRLRMPGACKPWCVGMFFAGAVSLPVLLYTGWRWEWAAAAAAFGFVCVGNCLLLRDASRRGRWSWSAEALLCVAWASLPLLHREARPVSFACMGAVALLWVLQRARQRLAPLTFRALADLALVVPAVLGFLLF